VYSYPLAKQGASGLGSLLGVHDKMLRRSQESTQQVLQQATWSLIGQGNKRQVQVPGRKQSGLFVLQKIAVHGRDNVHWSSERTLHRTGHHQQ